MEVSVALYLETRSVELADFILSMWDIDTQPVTEDDVAEAFQAAYRELEFIDEPDVKKRLSDIALAAYYDTQSSLSVFEELVRPLLNTELKQLIVCMAGDEGNEWYRIKNGGLESFRPKIGTDDGDILERVIQAGQS